MSLLSRLFGPAPVATPIACPACHAIEHMTVRPAMRSEVVGGEVKQTQCGVCVVCLRCDTPFVVVGHEPGGVIKRRRVAAGVEIPPPRSPEAPKRKGDANEIIDGLASALGTARVMEEPD